LDHLGPVLGSIRHHLPVGDAGVCIGGEADADVPSFSATINTSAFIVNPWNCCPQLLAEVGDTAWNMAIFIAPDMPCQLQVIPAHFLINTYLATFV
jgi:hypothetical protein